MPNFLEKKKPFTLLEIPLSDEVPFDLRAIGFQQKPTKDLQIFFNNKMGLSRPFWLAFYSDVQSSNPEEFCCKFFFQNSLNKQKEAGVGQFFKKYSFHWIEINQCNVV